MPFRTYVCERCDKQVYVLVRKQPDLAEKATW